MEFKSNTPIYLQVIQDIRNRMISGELKEGSRLPSSRELALQYEINPNTAARVYMETERMGITGTRRGVGTFVTAGEETIQQMKEERLRELITGFVAEIRALGYELPEIMGQMETYDSMREEKE